MANITITVQSLLNTAVYDSYTIDNGQTVNQLKTAINSARGFDSTWYDIVLNQSVVAGTATLSSLGIVAGTQLRTHNKIARLATRELRQKAKLNLATLDRAASGEARATYDITELPTQYSSNTVVDNANAGGLVEGRPWIEQAYTIPSGMDHNEPYIHSGTYKTAAAASIPAYSLQGTKYTPAYVASVTNETAGLYRRKYVGNFNSSNGSTTFDMAFFTTPSHGPISETAYEIDEYVSFGQRGDLPYESSYSFEWKGYLQVPITGDYNTHISCDDNVVMWIGDNALPANITDTNYHQFSGYTGGYNTNPNSIALTTGVWYPVRLWFTEYGGAERFQLYMSTGSNTYNGEDLTWAHNSATKGY
jgi:hypothetical protein